MKRVQFSEIKMVSVLVLEQIYNPWIPLSSVERNTAEEGGVQSLQCLPYFLYKLEQVPHWDLLLVLLLYKI